MAHSSFNIPSGSSNARQCKFHSVANFVADPMQLFRIRCTKCNYIRDFAPAPAPDESSTAKYLYYRQHTRSSLRLLSMFSPLADESVSYLARATFECGIISRATTVTIVEGLEPNIDHGPALQALRTALEFDPTSVVVGFYCVPYQDSTNDFIFADLALIPCVNCAAHKVSQNMVAV